MASKARTMGYVGGTAPPDASKGAPREAANAATRSPVTSSGAVGGNSRPTRDWSTGMPRP